MPQNPRGRPRSESTRRAILEATRDIIVESGFSRLSIEGIAARAGAGKQTIYRWWSSKSVIIADAVLEGYLRVPPAKLPQTESLADDLHSWARAVGESLSDPATAAVMRALTAAASDDEAEGALMYEQMTSPFYASLIDRLTRGQEAGQLDASVSPDVVAEALLGALLFRSLSRRPAKAPLTAVVDALLRNRP